MAAWRLGAWRVGAWREGSWRGMTTGETPPVWPPQTGGGGAVDPGSPTRRSLSSGPTVYPFGKKSDRAKTLKERIEEIEREIGAVEREIAKKENGPYFAGVEGQILRLWNHLGKLEDELDELKEKLQKEENAENERILEEHFRKMH